MTIFDFSKLDSRWLEELGQHYEEEGYCVLTGLTEPVTNRFYPVLMDALGISSSHVQRLLDPRSTESVLPEAIRQKMSRVPTPPSLAEGLIHELKPVLQHLVGPLVHVSANFHVQFKCGATGRVGYGGYNAQEKYMEVHGAYQLHQDFTGASFPTSPSHMILWLGLNDCPEWPVRLYPRSHQLGLLCERFIPVDHPRVAEIGKPFEFRARPGTAIIFNALVLHGTGQGAACRRVSCDLRFFPSCGFLPSRLHSLADSPWDVIQKRLQGDAGPTRRAPLLENLALSGQRIGIGEVPCCSILNWSKYLDEVCNGDTDRAIPHLERFTNTNLGFDSADKYIAKFHGRPMQVETLRNIRDLMAVGQLAS